MNRSLSNLNALTLIKRKHIVPPVLHFEEQTLKNIQVCKQIKCEHFENSNITYVKCIQCIFEENLKIRTSGAIWIQLIQHITRFLHLTLYINSFSPMKHLSHVYKRSPNLVSSLQDPWKQRIGWLWFLPLLSKPILIGGIFAVLWRKLLQ